MDGKDITPRIASLLYALRGQPVVLDADVAEFFGTETRVVNQYVKRNPDKFTEAYAFQLTDDEWRDLKSQTVISSSHGGRRTRPWAFTEHGFTMLSMGMRGPEAARIAHAVIDTFVQYRRGTLTTEPVITGPDGTAQRRRILDAVYKQMQAIAAMPLPTGETFGDELETVTRSAIQRIKAVIDAPVVKQDQVIAEIARVEAETAKIYADIQKTEAETARIWVEVVKGRLDAVVQLRNMAIQLERDDAVELIDDVFGDTARDRMLPKP